MSQSRPAVVLEGVRRSFEKKIVLRDLGAEAAPGRVIGLLGRNGAGKSTLFKVLLDLLAADSGRVEVLGFSPDGTGALRRHVGYVPERPAFHDFMTPRQVFELRARFFGSWSMERALHLAARLELDCEARLGGASKGALAKTAWVCAVAHDPALLMLDEPTSGLDALVREDILTDLIGELAGGEKTILIANHRMEELGSLLDEVWVMREGRIAAVHEVEDLRAQACRLTGRLKAGASLPAGLRLASLPDLGQLTQWAALDRHSAESVASARLMDGLQSEPLPLATTLRLLLVDVKGEFRHV